MSLWTTGIYLVIKNTQNGHFLIRGKKGRGTSTTWALCVHVPTNEGMRNRQSEAGKGRVREETKKYWNKKETQEQQETDDIYQQKPFWKRFVLFLFSEKTGAAIITKN